MTKNKIYTYLTIFTALLLSVIAAVFSVRGISSLFSGHYYLVMILASAIELSKIIMTSILYRYWKEISRVLKYYMSMSVIILMIITSAGIYGFLSEAYQLTKQDFAVNNNKIKSNETKVQLYSTQLESLKKQKDDNNDLINKNQRRIDSLYNRNNYSVAKRMESQVENLVNSNEKINTKISVISDSLQSITFSSANLQEKNLSSDVGSLLYIAKIFNKDIDTIAQFFILLLIIVFDPIAISLLITFNMILKKETDDTTNKAFSYDKEVDFDFLKKYVEKNEKTEKATAPDYGLPYKEQDLSKDFYLSSTNDIEEPEDLVPEVRESLENEEQKKIEQEQKLEELYEKVTKSNKNKTNQPFPIQL